MEKGEKLIGWRWDLNPSRTRTHVDRPYSTYDLCSTKLQSHGHTKNGVSFAGVAAAYPS